MTQRKIANSQVEQITSNKAAPMATAVLGPTLDFGSSSQHSTSFRAPASSIVTVQADSFFTGTDEFWFNNGNPSNPGPMPIGGSAIFGLHTAGSITFVAASGVTINYPDSLTLSKVHAKCTLIKVADSVWDLEGHLDPAP